MAEADRERLAAGAGGGAVRDGAEVAELTGLEMAAWPAGTRAFCRRERPHPGAQLSFADHDRHRFQAFITSQTGARIPEEQESGVPLHIP